MRLANTLWSFASMVVRDDQVGGAGLGLWGVYSYPLRNCPLILLQYNPKELLQIFLQV